MPGIDGIKTSEIIKQKFPDLTILLCTGDDDVRVEDHKHLNGILSKPLNIG